MTGYESKIDLLLMEVFSKLFNAQNYVHQGLILGGLPIRSLPLASMFACLAIRGPAFHRPR